MTEHDLADFAARLNLPSIELGPGQPFGFTLHGLQHFTLQFNEEGRLCLIADIELKTYDRTTLKLALSTASYLCKERTVDYAVGFVRDKLLLMHLLPEHARGADVVTAVLGLYEQAQKLIKETADGS